MPRQDNPNLRVLEATVKRLGPVAEELVFLGGCATGLLLSDKAAPPPRITRDVDTIVEVASLGDYYRLSERLKERGFREDRDVGAPLCRWAIDKIILDVMPTRDEVLGFGNRWYELAYQSSTLVGLPSGAIIRLVTAPCFIATKLEAFRGRGRGDYVLSHDVEDIVAVIDGRPELAGEIQDGDPALRRFLVSSLNALSRDRSFRDSIPGHLPPDEASQARAPLILRRIEEISAIE